ncbi:MAG TPA: hypothetical protein VF641_10445 [Methylobacterium sp.]
MGVNNKPDEIAAAAGLPRGETANDTIRKVSEDVHAGSGAAASDAKAKAGNLADKASETIDGVKARAASLADDVKDRLGGTADDLRSKASSTYAGTKEWASDLRDGQRRRIEDLADRGTHHVRRGKSAVEDFVSENPLLVGVVGVAAGLLLGALLPRTRREDRTVGHWADEVKDTGLRYAREFTERGREFVETALDPDNLNAAVERDDPPAPKSQTDKSPAAKGPAAAKGPTTTSQY